MEITKEEIPNSVRINGISKKPLQATDLAGIYVPTVTLKGPDLGFDEPRQAMLLEELIIAGVAGIVPNGTTGECATQKHDMHIRTTKFAYDAINQIAQRPVQLIAGAGTNSLEEGKELVQGIRESIGHGLSFLVVTPYYNKPNQNDLLRYYPDLAASVPDCTLVLYSIKGRTGIRIEAQTAIELSKHPQIIGLKDGDGDMEKVEKIIEGTEPNEFRVLTGEDNLMLKIMQLYQKHNKGPGYGAIAAASNLAPAVWKNQYDAAAIFEMDRAERIQKNHIEPIKEAVFYPDEPNPKMLLYAFGSEPWPPLYPPGEDAKRHMDKTISDFKYALGINIRRINPKYRDLKY